MIFGVTGLMCHWFEHRTLSLVIASKRSGTQKVPFAVRPLWLWVTPFWLVTRAHRLNKHLTFIETGAKIPASLSKSLA
jgi:uncharacterized membrane protein YwaF